MGNLHTEDALYKILGLTFDLSETIRNGMDILKEQKETNAALPDFNEKNIEEMVFKAFCDNINSLPTHNGLYIITQLLGRIGQRLKNN